MMEKFDVILAGGGAAGLSLAWHLVHEGPVDYRILIVDREQKISNDRTWCFWSATPGPFDPIVANRWKSLLFFGEGFSKKFALDPYEYRMIRGIDFYREVLADLRKCDRVVFVSGNVDSIEDGAERALVNVDGTTYSGAYVFDSLFTARDFRVDETKYHFVKQHFVGWVIKTERPVFDEKAATLFDLRIPQNGAMRFMYILPNSPTEALLEYTLFSVDLLPREEYDAGIRDYIRDFLGDVSFEIIEKEDGIIPMTDQPFPRRAGNRIMRIGTAGGMVKASTGFAFHRTNRDSRRIVESLVRKGHPFHGISPPRRYRTFDAMLLHVLAFHGERGAAVFTGLFRDNPLSRLFRFLDEEGSLTENIALMTTVPWALFIRAYLHLRLLRPIRVLWKHGWSTKGRRRFP